MLNPRSLATDSHLPPPGTEAAAHLASLHGALRTADLIAGKCASEAARPTEITQVWPDLPESTRRCFGARAGRTARIAQDGLELLGSGAAHPAAAMLLSDELRAGIAAIERLFADR